MRCALGLALAWATHCCSSSALASLPPTPAAAEVLEATPFTLDSPLSLPTGPFSEGLVLVVRSTPEMTRARQGPMPVLQCGARLAMAASRGEDGLLVAIVLGPADLQADAVFFSPPELPARLGPAELARREAQAMVAGLRPMAPEAAVKVLAAGAAELRLRAFEDIGPFLMGLRCRWEPEALAVAGVPCPDAP